METRGEIRTLSQMQLLSLIGISRHSSLCHSRIIPSKSFHNFLSISYYLHLHLNSISSVILSTIVQFPSIAFEPLAGFIRNIVKNTTG